MLFSRNKKGKLTSKAINDLTRGPKTMGLTSPMPLSKEIKLVDLAHVSLFHAKSDGPIFGVESEYGLVPEDICDVFVDGEEFDVDVKGDKLVLTKGKDQYWFRLYLYDDVPPKLPTLEKLKTRFSLETSQVAKAAKGLKGATVARIRAGYDKAGKKTVWLFIYDKNDELMQGLNLGVPWYGSESATAYPMEYLKDVGKFADQMDVEYSSDYPMRGRYSVEGRDMEYYLAPVVRSDEDDDWGMQTSAEDGWIASHNRRNRGCKNCTHCGQCGNIRSANAKGETVYYYKRKRIGNILDMENFVFSKEDLLKQLIEDYDLDIWSGPYGDINKGVIGELLFDIFESPYIEGQTMYGISCRQPIQSTNRRRGKR